MISISNVCRSLSVCNRASRIKRSSKRRLNVAASLMTKVYSFKCSEDDICEIEGKKRAHQLSQVDNISRNIPRVGFFDRRKRRGQTHLDEVSECDFYVEE